MNYEFKKNNEFIMVDVDKIQAFLKVIIETNL